jgi:hypothetical protein
MMGGEQQGSVSDGEREEDVAKDGNNVHKKIQVTEKDIIK